MLRALGIETGKATFAIIGREFSAQITRCCQLGNKLCPIERAQFLAHGLAVFGSVCARRDGGFPFEHGDGL